MAQLVARSVRDAEVARSSRVAPTISISFTTIRQAFSITGISPVFLWLFDAPSGHGIPTVFCGATPPKKNKRIPHVALAYKHKHVVYLG